MRIMNDTSLLKTLARGDDAAAGEIGGRAGRKAETRQRLLAAALRLFSERGFHETRPQDIARMAGVGHGTFYVHFEDKGVCFLAVVGALCEELDTRVADYMKGEETIEGQMRAILNAVFDFARLRLDVLSLALTDVTVIAPDKKPQLLLMDLWAEKWAIRIRRGQEAGLVDPTVDAEVMGHAINGMVTQACMGARRHGFSQEAVIDQLTSGIVSLLTVSD